MCRKAPQRAVRVGCVKRFPPTAERVHMGSDLNQPHSRSYARRALLLATGGAVIATVLPPTFVHSASGQVNTVPSTRVFHVMGHGWGHGHGMSQDGANGAASVKHMSATQIVSFYYPHTSAGSIGNPTMRILLQSTASNYVDVGK